MPGRRGARVPARAVLDLQVRLSLRELSERTGLTATELIDMVEEGLIEAEGRRPPGWRFAARAAERVGAALRLQRDLGLNLAGAALVLDLLEQMRELRGELERLRLLLPPER